MTTQKTAAKEATNAYCAFHGLKVQIPVNAFGFGSRQSPKRNGFTAHNQRCYWLISMQFVGFSFSGQVTVVVANVIDDHVKGNWIGIRIRIT